ncbi:hypothetical protein [Streptomyces sp. NPDC058424]|uniref:hypothetical protein n=1 Tax=Streptomyces sp. NPDC058424 TaxID=3346491 RepID=UPI00366285E4
MWSLLNLSKEWEAGDLRHVLLARAPVHALAAGGVPTGTVLHIYGPAGLATISVDERLL